jgi:hypothetical protein
MKPADNGTMESESKPTASKSERLVCLKESNRQQLADDPEFAQKMEIVESILERYEETFRRLADS